MQGMFSITIFLLSSVTNTKIAKTDASFLA